MKFFFIVAQSPTSQQQNAITAIFHGKPQYGYWHWTQDFWVITTMNDVLAVGLRDAIKIVVPELPIAVFAFTPKRDWAMYSDPKWADWVNKEWVPNSWNKNLWQKLIRSRFRISIQTFSTLESAACER